MSYTKAELDKSERNGILKKRVSFWCPTLYYDNAYLLNIVNINKLYMSFGSFTTVTNILCMLVVLLTKQMRQKFGALGLLSFGDMLNVLGMVIA
uniref:Uncharacterized protein n=1 Tax=Plectus sambesii TaxID=2011161 RepID=A0A914WST2_9BILA